jgi:hypothetical protein
MLSESLLESKESEDSVEYDLEIVHSSEPDIACIKAALSIMFGDWTWKSLSFSTTSLVSGVHIVLSFVCKEIIVETVYNDNGRRGELRLGGENSMVKHQWDNRLSRTEQTNF